MTKLEYKSFGFVLLIIGVLLGSYIATSKFIIPRILAADSTNQSWTFTTAADYTCSQSDTACESSTSMEVTGTSARLRLRQYTGLEASTSLLLHLDESSGAPTDSSSNAHTVTNTNATYTTTTGSFNNAASFGGSDAYMRVDDSSALSLSGSHSLEAWYKFDTAPTTTSHGQDQVILDKGDYSVWFDSQLGKFGYKIKSNASQSWAQAAGGDLYSSWNTNITSRRNANAITQVTHSAVTYTYAGLGSIVGDSEVWKYTPSSTSWAKIGGDGINSSWADSTYEEVTAMVGIGQYLYVGLGNGGSRGEVWRWDEASDSWSQIAGPANFGAGIERVQTMANYNGDLVVGLGNTAGTGDDSDVWRWNETSDTWAQLGGTNGTSTVNSGWADAGNYEIVYSLVSDGTYLYAGLGNSADDGDVWRFNDTTDTWTQVGGTNGVSTINGGWTDADNIEAVWSMAVSGTNLCAGIGSSSNGSGDDDAEVWCVDLTDGTLDWDQMGGNGVNSSAWTNALNYETVQSLAFVGTTLYAGLGNTADDGDVFSASFSGYPASTSTTWTQVGGTNSGGTTVGSAWENVEDILTTYAMYSDGSTLYVANQASAHGAEVWSYNGSSWTFMGGQFVNKSWGYYGMDAIKTLATGRGSDGNRKMYAGTGTISNTYPGDAMVFEYDGSTWQIIGGQGVNSSWAHSTYYTVNDLLYLKGYLYAAIGASTVTGNDQGEVWRYNVSTSTWERIANGGTSGTYNSWTTNDDIENVLSLATDGTYIYAGLGSTVNGGTAPTSDDGQVWRFDPSTPTWTIYGGPNTSATTINGGWANTGVTGDHEAVTALAYDGKYLYSGLGSSNDDADVWRVDTSSGSPDWEPIGGTDATTGTSTINSSWHANDNIDQVMDLAVYQGELYAALGTGNNEAQVWKWNGSVWSQIGGPGGSDDSYTVYNSSWPALTFETVRGLTVMDGYLYAGLGNTTGEAEIWRFDGSTWTRVGGTVEGWAAASERLWDMASYEGRLYAGFGDTANTDAAIWSYGGATNILYSSTTSALGVNDTDMHYLLATYNSGSSTMSLYVDSDSTADTTKTGVSVTVNDSAEPLYIGSGHGSTGARGPGYLDGFLDEVRISSTVRSASDLIESNYSSDREYVQPEASVMTSDVARFTGFSATDNAEGTYTFQLSDDNASTWKYWNGSTWTSTGGSLANANSESDVNTNISSFPITSSGIRWRAILQGNGTTRPTVSDVTVTANIDTDNPNNPTLLSALSQSSGGTAISSGGTYPYPNPYFSWTGATDDNGDGDTADDSGISGYDVYWGTDPNPDLDTYGTFQSGSTYSPSGLVNGTTYYFAIRSVDKAQNTASSNFPSPVFSYTYSFASPKPSNVDYINPASGTFGNIAAMNFSWPTTGAAAAAPYEGGPDIVGWQYAINNQDDWLGTYTDVGLGIDYIPLGYTQPHYLTVDRDGSYITVGDNTIYFRAVDEDGNFAEPVAGIISYGGAAPTFTANCSVTTGITVDPSTSDTNSFSLSWDPATPDSGNFVTNYYYMVNTPPPATLSTITSNAAVYIDNETDTSVSAAQLPGAIKGSNLVYVVAVDDEDNYAPGNCLKGAFTLDSEFPDPPANVTVSDASVKATSLWRASLAWEEPEYKGTGTLTYKIQRSEDGTTWTNITTTTGNAYVDTLAASQPYYWRIGTYDNSSESQASPSYANAVTLTPKGSYSTPPTLISEPEVTSITTKRATISWSTSRTSDSKVQFGTAPGNYFSEEPSNSAQVTSHVINLTNLEPGTTYHYKVKWTDEDGNTGTSSEYTFTTQPAPSVKDVKEKTIGLDNVLLEFVTTGASSVKIYYGKTTGFGGVKTIATSLGESTYTASLDELEDGAKYYYKINLLDSEDAEYEGTILDFETLPRPEITGIRLQEVKGTAQPTVFVTWTTNTEVSSIITYYPTKDPGSAKDEVNVALVKGTHRMLVKGLNANSEYTMIVKGRDKMGNEAQSEPQRFTTLTDTRAPQISNLKVEGSTDTGSDGVSTAQIVVSWDTDELSTSQVEYGEGTGTTYAQKTQEDKNLTVNHIVVITGLTPSKVYHLRALSKDNSENEGQSIDTTTITPKATRSALDLVISNLSEAFGFLKSIQ